MKRKKIMMGILAVMLLSLVACGKRQGTTKAETAKSVEKKSEKRQVEIPNFNTDAVIEETVLVDEDNVKIIATDLSYTEDSVNLNLLIENNSDKDLSFSCGSALYHWNSVNGYMFAGGYMNADLNAGKKSNETVEFDMEELRIYGITEIASIQLGFDITDEAYDHTHYANREIKTSIAADYDISADTYKKAVKEGIWEMVYDCSIDYFAEEELYNESDVQIISEALMTNKDDEHVILLEVQNNSQNMLYGVVDDVFINGLKVPWNSSETINPGTRRIMALSVESILDKNYWETFGISGIDTFGFLFHAADEEYTEKTAQKKANIQIAKKVQDIDAKGEEVYNEGGIHIISKGLFELDDGIHMVLMAENNTSGAISIDDDYDSLSVNGFMTDYYWWLPVKPEPKECAVIDVEMRENSLEENKITSIEDITEAEIGLEITDSKGNTIAEPMVSIKYE